MINSFLLYMCSWYMTYVWHTYYRLLFSIQGHVCPYFLSLLFSFLPCLSPLFLLSSKYVSVSPPVALCFTPTSDMMWKRQTLLCKKRKCELTKLCDLRPPNAAVAATQYPKPNPCSTDPGGRWKFSEEPLENGSAMLRKGSEYNSWENAERNHNTPTTPVTPATNEKHN